MTAELATAEAKASRRRAVLPIACREGLAAEVCRGRVTLSALLGDSGRVVLGSAALSQPTDTTRKLTVSLSAAARRALHHIRSKDTSKIDIDRSVARVPVAEPLDVDRLTTAIEDFNTIFIRLASVQRLNFSTLSVLHSLSRRGPMRLTDLLATEQIKQPALTNLVSKLETAGLVSRRPDPSDGRAALLSLTSEGEAVVRSRHADRVAKLARLIDRLDDHDRAVLADAEEVLSRLVVIAHDTPIEPSGGSQVRSHARRMT